jgi:5-formyltetrahydrofolate cyclo-ligase
MSAPSGKPYLPTACPTCCSGSRATVRTGTCGWRQSFASAATVNPPSPPHDLPALRRWLRARRRDITGQARRDAALRVARLIEGARWLRPGRRIGLYLAMPDELDTAPLIARARKRGCHIAVPRITSTRHNRMRFEDLAGALHRGAFGISEPAAGAPRQARELDVVFLPLVGFDRQGNRIGMGRGFYDRFFAHRARMRRWCRPLLVGIAYDEQCVSALQPAAHDVPLDALVTQSTVLRFGRRRT